MERTFAMVLQSALDAKPWTAYQLSEETGVPRSGLSNYLSGKTVPEDKTLAKLADALGADFEELKAFADIHRLGVEGIERIKKFAPEVLDGGLVVTSTSSEPEADPYAAVRSAFPSDMKHPLKLKELKILKAMGPQGWADYDIRPGSYLWTVPFEQRWPEIKEAWEGWKEDHDGAGVPAREA